MNIPKNVQQILNKLHSKGHEAYIVGGCVRDMLLKIEPHDYDITTSAEPEVVKALFDKTIDTGIEHGTVTVMMDKEGYEVTTYRIDGKYLDNRRPESVAFTKSLEEDLLRRDFTINAMAYNEEDGVIDLYNGQEDLKAGVIRCVGVAEERFREDGLRMLRAIRFAARFGFEIEAGTETAICMLNELIKNISGERVHMELTKTLCSDHPEYIERLVTYGLIEYIIPEFTAIVGLAQNHPYHSYSVDRHTYECLKYTAGTEALRWAIYLHDIGKGSTRTTDEKGIDHFYGHPKISVEQAGVILKRLKFDNKTRKRVMDLIGYHDYRFKSDPKSVRKAMAKMGPDMFMDYLAVQFGDIMGQAMDKAPDRLKELEIKEAVYKQILEAGQCVTIKGLKVDGKDLMTLGLGSGQAIGDILRHLLKRVIDLPEMNTKEQLMKEALVYGRSKGYLQ